jgi:oxygen-independent coproporphyrinogen III oxidase
MVRDTAGRLARLGLQMGAADHFLRAADPVLRARRSGAKAARDLQGFPTLAEYDHVCIGPGASGRVGDFQMRNAERETVYRERLASGRLAVDGGYVLDRDDLLRREIISSLMCCFRVDLASLETSYGIPLEGYFEAELHRIGKLAEGGLLRRKAGLIEILPQGQPAVRSVCRIFDRYAGSAREKRTPSAGMRPARSP